MAIKIRMCIVCRGRFKQNKLQRLRCFEGEIIKYNNFGRSFYLCQECINTESNVLIKKVNKICKNRAMDTEKLKEIFTL